MPKVAKLKGVLKRQQRFRELTSVGLDRLFASNSRYLGCYSKDQLPTAADMRGHFIVINLQNHNAGTGSHWVMLYDGMSSRGCFYFDSMGAPPPNEVLHLMNSLSTASGHQYNHDEVQELDSITCGYFCAFVARQLCAGKGVHGTMARFSTTDFAKNEAMVKASFSG